MLALGLMPFPLVLRPWVSLAVPTLAALSSSGTRGSGDSRQECLVSLEGCCPWRGRCKLTILFVGFVAEVSKVLVEGFQWDTHSIMPALPGEQQLGIAS